MTEERTLRKGVRVTLDLYGRQYMELREMAATARWPQTRILRTGLEALYELGNMLRQGHTIQIRDAQGKTVALPLALRRWVERVKKEMRCASELMNQEQELGLDPSPSAPASSSMTCPDSPTPRP